MAVHTVTWLPAGRSVRLATGTTLTEGLREAGLDLAQPCGGQGRCGRCVVQVTAGSVRRRSTLRLSPADLEAGYALACQAMVEGDATVRLLATEAELERRMVTDKCARRVEAPFDYDPARDQTIRAFALALPEPTLTDAVDDWARVERGLAAYGIRGLEIPLPLLQTIGERLRSSNWRVTAIVETDTWRRPGGPVRLIELLPGAAEAPAGLYGLAIDIGTTTVTLYLVDLHSGQVIDTAAEYNGQIARGEDVISRVIYAGKNNGLDELASLVRTTINTLIGRLAARNHVRPDQLYKASVVGNTIMLHLFLGIPPASIRLAPYIPAANQPTPWLAGALGLKLHPLANVDCLPGVASYVGADITAGVLASGLADSQALTLFIDVGTNGEIVLGNRDWLMTCACSAGPAFEGAGVLCGMRATRGAIEEVWINQATREPTYRVIGEGAPRGLCGSGLIALLAELFITGIIDKGGKFKLDLGTPRVRVGDHGAEYVVVWAGETGHGRDIVLTAVDIDNLIRAKGAIFAGFAVLAKSVGLSLDAVERLLVGGSFGQYINVEKAVQIGLLPDLAWERFTFLGNTAVQGAYQALLSREARSRLQAIAARMTYLELSADNTFYDAFTSALFLPHTDLEQFPTVARLAAAGENALAASSWGGKP